MSEDRTEDQERRVALVRADHFFRHLVQFANTFECPVCHSRKAWSASTLVIPRELAQNGVDADDAALEVVMPRALTPFVPNLELLPTQALPVACQTCGYIALFDAEVVQRKTREYDSNE